MSPCENSVSSFPADRIYKHLETNMLNSSCLLREVSNRIEELNDGTPEGSFVLAFAP